MTQNHQIFFGKISKYVIKVLMVNYIYIKFLTFLQHQHTQLRANNNSLHIIFANWQLTRKMLHLKLSHHFDRQQNIPIAEVHM